MPTSRPRESALLQGASAHAQEALGAAAEGEQACADQPQSFGARLMLAAGDVVGSFEVLRRIGVGGISEVWAVRHLRSGEERALKVLLRPSPAHAQRLIRESATHAALCHPNILPVLGVLRHETQLGILMPLVHGPSLEQFLAQGVPLSQAQALGIFRGIVLGVAHAHERRVVHRDLKPDNTMLDLSGPTMVARIMDFGIARNLDELGTTRAGQMLGTPTYSAPEQLADASTAGVQADLFSLGVLLVRLLAGHLPFDGETLEDIRAAHRSGPDLSGLDERFVPLVRDLLAYSPHDRPSSIAAMRARMAALDLEVEAPPSTLASVTRWTRPLRPAPRLGAARSATEHDTLPSPNDAMQGREADLRVVMDALFAKRPGPAARLLTLCGGGGVGKTRVAEEVAHEAKDFLRHVWWLDLAQLPPGASVLPLLASRLGLSPSPEDGLSSLEGRVWDKLASAERYLLVFDTAEHVHAQVAGLIGRLRSRCEGALILVTSRVPLRLRHELLVPLQGLTASEGRELFFAAARANGVQVTRTPSTEARVDRLLRSLDGNPLEIELAAGQLSTNSLSAISEMSGEELLCLSSRTVDRPERHLSSLASLDWSWALLSTEEQRVFAGCSVFCGEFTVDAAHAVLGGSEPAALRSTLGNLADAGLIQRRFDASGSLRLSLLRRDLAYATLRQGELGGREQLVVRHAAWFSGPRLGPHLSRSGEWIERTLGRGDADNLFAVAERRHEHGDPRAAARAILLADAALNHKTASSQLLEYVESSLQDELPAPLRAQLLLRRLQALETRGDLAALATGLGQAFRFTSAHGLADPRAVLLLQRARLQAFWRGRLSTAARDVAEAMELSNTASAHTLQAQLLQLAGAPAKALLEAERATQQAVMAEDQHALVEALLVQGELLLENLEGAAGLEATVRARTIAEERDEASQTGRALALEARCLLEAGQVTSALHTIERSMETLDGLEEDTCADEARLVLVEIQAHRGHLVAAKALGSLLSRRFRARGQVVSYVRIQLLRSKVAMLQGELDEASTRLRSAEGVLSQVETPGLLEHTVVQRAALDAAGLQGDRVLAGVEPWLGDHHTPSARTRLDLGLQRARGLALVGLHQEALDSVHDLLIRGQSTGLGCFSARLHLERARMQRDAGQLAEAMAAYDLATRELARAEDWPLHSTACAEHARLPGAGLHRQDQGEDTLTFTAAQEHTGPHSTPLGASSS